MMDNQEPHLNNWALECHLASEKARAREMYGARKLGALLLLIGSLSFGVREWQAQHPAAPQTQAGQAARYHFHSEPAMRPTNADGSEVAPLAPDPVAERFQRNDGIVCVNKETGIYYFPGQRGYANNAPDQYMSQDQAEASGYKRSYNGQ